MLIAAYRSTVAKEIDVVFVWDTTSGSTAEDVNFLREEKIPIAKKRAAVQSNEKNNIFD